MSEVPQPLRSAIQHPRVRIVGVTGDNHDRDRVVLRIQNEDENQCQHLSFPVDELLGLSEWVADFEPTLRANWAKRDAQR